MGDAHRTFFWVVIAMKNNGETTWHENATWMSDEYDDKTYKFHGYMYNVPFINKNSQSYCYGQKKKWGMENGKMMRIV